jgi:hypothetical protein
LTFVRSTHCTPQRIPAGTVGVARGICDVAIVLDWSSGVPRALISLVRSGIDRASEVADDLGPQGDRSKDTSEGGNADLAAAAGITVRGAKMLGTGATLLNEVLVTSVRPLKPEDDLMRLPPTFRSPPKT